LYTTQIMDLLDRKSSVLNSVKAGRLCPLWWVGLSACLVLVAHAQVPISGRGRNFVAPVTDAQGRKTVLYGASFEPAAEGLKISGMRAETFRGQEKDMIVQAPQCVFDQRTKVATSPETLSIRTADDRFTIEGKAFRWQLGDSRLNSKLVISNQVHSLVRKRLVAPKAAGGVSPGLLTKPVSNSVSSGASASGTNAVENDFVTITANRFEYQGDSAVYRGFVRVHEAESELACDVLTVVFKSDTGALERIEAQNDVILTQGTTRTAAEKAIYTVSQESEILQFIGHVLWSDGQREGGGEQVLFDRRKRTLRAEQNAYLKLPRGILGQTAFTPGLGSAGKTEGGDATRFVEVFAGLMTIQFPLTNGPVQQIIAEKNVLIVDPGQNGRALADRAVYEDLSGVLELSGSPLMETDGRLVTGQTLRFDRATRIFTAGPDAYVKLPLEAVANLGVFALAAGTTNTASLSTNRFIEIWAKEFAYGTNQLHFRSEVRANFLESDLPVAKLTCGSLLIRYGQELESATAEGDVELEGFAAPDNVKAAGRKLTCPMLEVRFAPGGRLASAAAKGGVTAEQRERPPNAPEPIVSQLNCRDLTAIFSSVTNRVETVTADGEVVIAREMRVARGAKAVYSDASGLLELTGDPIATMPEGQISGAERLMWDRVRGRFVGKGKFRSEWRRTSGATNRLSRPLTQVQ
jgi:lipopolysaccharide export system protein LptA